MPETNVLRRGDGPLILSIPHAGTVLTPGLSERLTPVGTALVDTDWWLERLYAGPWLDALDPTILRATLSRTVIDLNRDPEGASLYPGQATTALVPTEGFDGEPLYRPGMEPDSAEIAVRRDAYFWPYHDLLATEIARVKARHGVAGLYDCHSIRSHVPRLFAGELTNLNLGTNAGASCAPELRARLIAELAGTMGYSHVADGRFKGGWITRHYGRPEAGVHAVQMEIACRSYMQEAPPAYDDAKAAALQTVLAGLLTAMQVWLLDPAPTA